MVGADGELWVRARATWLQEREEGFVQVERPELEGADLGLEVAPAPGGGALFAVGAVPEDRLVRVTDGITVLRALREQDPGAPVVLMTGYTERSVGDQTVGDPHTAMVRKPFGGATLTAAVRDATRGRSVTG